MTFRVKLYAIKMRKEIQRIVKMVERNLSAAVFVSQPSNNR